MATDLELCQLGLPNIRISPIKTRQTLQSCGGGKENISSNRSNFIKQETTTCGVDVDGDGCRTPTSEEHKIPAILSCPPAPRKPRRGVSCKRKLSEFDFFEIVKREEVDRFFQSAFETTAKRRCRPCK
ncbi:hypothetical protein Tsubulata_029282 [Turnera subulata]|uniref:Cyclin-dependent protein kinase inhibitor n=1 Tax=Turnera subulata TaxID=218843 RepID=A0A9Q0FTF6_9ROSI|nr:hypothetical protein Tsubulata_029282 [Turnera subulata]